MACIFLINFILQAVIYGKSYTKKVFEYLKSLNNFKELPNFQFGKELTLKTLKNKCIEESSVFCYEYASVNASTYKFILKHPNYKIA